ncbi:unnamed protein product [Camellia sinensis]
MFKHLQILPSPGFIPCLEGGKSWKKEEKCLDFGSLGFDVDHLRGKQSGDV